MCVLFLLCSCVYTLAVMAVGGPAQVVQVWISTQLGRVMLAAYRYTHTPHLNHPLINHNHGLLSVCMVDEDTITTLVYNALFIIHSFLFKISKRSLESVEEGITALIV